MARDLSALVLPPEAGEAWWQPQPAGGYVVIKSVSPRLATGTQEIDPGGRVPRHRHPEAEEILFVYDGQGTALVEDQEVALCPGTLLVMPPNTWHSFINTGQGPLRLTWTISPPGLEGMFRTIGRPKQGEAPRPPAWPPPTREEVARFPERFGIERAPM